GDLGRLLRQVGGDGIEGGDHRGTGHPQQGQLVDVGLDCLLLPAGVSGVEQGGDLEAFTGAVGEVEGQRGHGGTSCRAAAHPAAAGVRKSGTKLVCLMYTRGVIVVEITPNEKETRWRHVQPAGPTGPTPMWPHPASTRPLPPP